MILLSLGLSLLLLLLLLHALSFCGVEMTGVQIFSNRKDVVLDPAGGGLPDPNQGGVNSPPGHKAPTWGKRKVSLCKGSMCGSSSFLSWKLISDCSHSSDRCMEGGETPSVLGFSLKVDAPLVVVSSF